MKNMKEYEFYISWYDYYFEKEDFSHKFVYCDDDFDAIDYIKIQIQKIIDERLLVDIFFETIYVACINEKGFGDYTPTRILVNLKRIRKEVKNV